MAVLSIQANTMHCAQNCRIWKERIENIFFETEPIKYIGDFFLWIWLQEVQYIGFLCYFLCIIEFEAYIYFRESISLSEIQRFRQKKVHSHALSSIGVFLSWILERNTHFAKDFCISHLKDVLVVFVLIFMVKIS